MHPLQRDCPADDPKKFAAWCWASGIPDPSPVRPQPIPLISPQLVEGVSEMLWEFGYRWHEDKQTKWIEGGAGLGTMAHIVEKKPLKDPLEDMAEEFLAKENPQLLEAIQKAPKEERERLIADLEKNFEVLQTLIKKMKGI